MADEAGAARGRPRPANTIERDETVLKAITAAGAEGLTRPALATSLEITGSEAYLSLYRLSRSGQITKEGNHWKAAGAPVQPEPAGADAENEPQFSDPAL